MNQRAERSDSLRLAFALQWGPLAQSKGRLLLSLLAIALGVALGYAVQLVNRSALQEFEQAVRSLSGQADLIVRAGVGGLPEEWYPRLARLPEIAQLSPIVEAQARVAGQDEPLRLLGVDVLRATSLNPALLTGEDIDTLDTLRPDTVFLSAAAADRLGLERGDSLALQRGLELVRLRVAGILAGERTAYGWLDIGAAQGLFDRVGYLDRIDLSLHSGVDVRALQTRLQAQLPAGTVVERPAEAVQRNANLSRAYRVNLNVLALVALFTGGLLVFSTQALSIVRRRSQLALLRVLGVTRRGIVAMLLREALLVGLAGAILGLILGHALAALVLSRFGADLGSGLFHGVKAELHVDLFAALAFLLAGLAAALLGSLLPAIEAARAAPAAALKAGDEQGVFRRLRPIAPGLVLLGIAGSLVLLPPIHGLPLFGYLAIALCLIGTILLLPRLAILAFGALPMPVRWPALQLTVAQLRGAPGQAMLSLAAIVASVSLLVSMAIMVTSFRVSLTDWLDGVLPADFYVRVARGSDTAFLGEDAQARLREVPGVRRLEFVRSVPLLLDPQRPPVQLLARPVDPEDPGRGLVLLESLEVTAGGAPPVWVSEAAAALYDFQLGRVIELPLGETSARFTVAGVWRDYARQHGAIVLDRALYIKLTGDAAASEAWLWRTPDADPGMVRQALLAALPRAGVEINSASDLRARSLRIFDRTFAITYALEAVALLIGLTALSASFGALVLLRRREFAMLRHVGMTRRQIGAMLAGEGFLVSALGLAVGVALGWLIALVLIHVVNRQSFHWGMELHVPGLALSVFVLIMLMLASVTAWLSGRYAVSSEAARAVREDW